MIIQSRHYKKKSDAFSTPTLTEHKGIKSGRVLKQITGVYSAPAGRRTRADSYLQGSLLTFRRPRLIL